MRITLQLIKSHIKQPIPAIVLTVDSQKYLFNINESYQRFFREHSQKVSKGTKIFVSQLSTDHISGLFGLLLTFQEQGFTENMQIYGPPGLSSYFLNIFFLNEKYLTPFSIYDFFNNHTKILGTNSRELMEKAKQEQIMNTISFNINGFLEKEQLTQKEAVNDPQPFIQNNSFYKDKFLEIHPILLSDQRNSLCYVIKPNKIPGRVNPDKLKAANIKSMYLKMLFEKGELEIDGKIYYAKDFKESDEPSPVAIIIDCPNVENLEKLFKEPKLTEFYADKIDLKETDLKLMVHIVPAKLLTDKRYQDFLTNFQSSCQHMFASEEIQPREIPKQIIPYKHFTLNNIFAKYFPDNFPILQDDSENDQYQLQDLFPLISKKATYRKLAEYIVSPSKNEGFAELPDPNEKNSSQIKFKENSFFVNKYNKWLQSVKSPSVSDRPFLALFEKCDPELVFLGVQSMLHSSHCNVSGMYLKFGQHNDTGILMDCGEGSYLQLLNHYGSEGVKHVLKNLKAIYITHYHSDHNTGIFQVMKERQKVTDEPLYLVVPFNCGPWVLKHSQIVEDLNCKIIFNQHLASKKNHTSTVEELKIDSEQSNKFGSYQDDKLYQDLNQLEKDSVKNAYDFSDFLSKELGVVEFKSVGVDHIPQSYALYIKHKEGWSFLYSGDTRPSESMVREVGDVTILVHESTFADDLKEQAQARMHSTDKEAIEIGIKLKAWRTILTHYSQRYTGRLFQQTDESELAEYFKDYALENVVRSWDHLGFKFSELHHLPTLNRCMQAMFNETQSSKNKF